MSESITIVKVGYLTLINLITMIVYFVDKRKAIHNRMRISENKLLLLAGCGGSIGALIAMYLFHHKIRKVEFAIGIPCILAFHILLIYLPLIMSLIGK